MHWVRLLNCQTDICWIKIQNQTECTVQSGYIDGNFCLLDEISRYFYTRQVPKILLCYKDQHNSIDKSFKNMYDQTFAKDGFKCKRMK